LNKLFQHFFKKSCGMAVNQKEDSSLEYLDLGFTITPDKEGNVHSVLCVSGTVAPFPSAFAGRTKEGIGIGSNLADVLRAYGDPTATDNIEANSGIEVLKYKPLGIMFGLEAGKVITIAMEFKPKS
ncbi:MAG: hypothetical protein WCH99_19250, partial [Verrucomicrobiota bacterium]